MRWRPRRYAQGLSQDSTIEGQPRTASVGGEIVSHVDEFFRPHSLPPPLRRPTLDRSHEGRYPTDPLGIQAQSFSTTLPTNRVGGHVRKRRLVVLERKHPVDHRMQVV